MKLDAEKDDHRRTVLHLARKVDEAIAFVESETNAKISALEAAMQVAESENWKQKRSCPRSVPNSKLK